MKILAVDTSTELCSAAIIIDGRVLARKQLAAREHTKILLPMVAELLAQAQLTLKQMDAIAFGRGPGSFTGVRIGVCMAQGLAFGADLPMIGISTLQALAQGAKRELGATKVLAAIDARMAEVYWGQYAFDNNKWQLVGSEKVQAPSSIVETLALDTSIWTQVGTGWDAYSEEFTQLSSQTKTSEILYPQAQDIVVLAAEEFKNGNFVPANMASPSYLRDKVTWKKLPGK